MGHWYRKDGTPAHYEGKNGADTTLREARKLDLYPSVTTVGNISSKPALTIWLQGEAVKETYAFLSEWWFDHWQELIENKDDEKAFIRQRIADARAKTTAKADAGTEIHDMLERFHEDPFEVTGDEKKMCFAISECIKENTGLSLFDHFTPEERFCNVTHGYAGMCDLHTNRKLLIEEPWVLDYKTKDTVDKKTRGFPEQAEQLAAYARGLQIPNARIGNIFISRAAPAEDEPWDVKFFEHKNPQYAWSCFLDTLHLWQKKNKFGAWYEQWVKSQEVENE